jgi:hypothetical protein
MCWVAAIPYALAALSAYSSYSGQNQAKQQGEYQAKVANNNATVSQWQADDAKARGDTAAANVRRQYAAMEGSQAATFASRGIDISEGSPNAILNDTSYFGQVDQNTVRANAAREAWGYKTRGQNFEAEGMFAQAGADARNPAMSGAAAGVSSYFGASGGFGFGAGKGGAGSNNTLLTSSGTVAPKWYGGTNGSAGSPTLNGYG